MDLGSRDDFEGIDCCTGRSLVQCATDVMVTMNVREQKPHNKNICKSQDWPCSHLSEASWGF